MIGPQNKFNNKLMYVIFCFLEYDFGHSARVFSGDILPLASEFSNNYLSVFTWFSSFTSTCSGERGTACHGAHSVSRVFSITIQFRYVVAI